MWRFQIHFKKLEFQDQKKSSCPTALVSEALLRLPVQVPEYSFNAASTLLFKETLDLSWQRHTSRIYLAACVAFWYRRLWYWLLGSHDKSRNELWHIRLFQAMTFCIANQGCLAVIPIKSWDNVETSSLIGELANHSAKLLQLCATYW